MAPQELDENVRRTYDSIDEDGRLYRPGGGELVRLRTWDIFDRFLPGSGTVADVGGGPGTHSAYLARAGYDVTLFDPVPRHVEAARARSAAQPVAPFRAEVGEARDLPLDDSSTDVVLLMGPLYHLVAGPDRLAALTEARRVLRPGGLLLAEVITRYAWVMDAGRKGLLGEAATWDDIDWNLRTGLSMDPSSARESGFWAYFHRLDEYRCELDQAGFTGSALLAVEGFAWLLGDLAEQLARDSAKLLAAVRLTEAEPSMLGASPHVIAVANR